MPNKIASVHMNDTDFNLLDLDSTIHDLPGFRTSVHPKDEGQDVLDIFNQQPALPGVLVMNDIEFIGFISRRTFFEHVGKRYGTEVYLRRSILFIFKQGVPPALTFPSYTKLSKAAQQALSRNDVEVYEPIIEFAFPLEYRIINIQTLFTAQNHILMMLHNQRVNAATSNLIIDDDVAIKKFLKLAGIPIDIDLIGFKTSYTIHCPQCGKMIKYSIADVVRSFPVIKQGIEISDRMGSRTYLFYVRHKCKDQIIDLPVQHDHNLEYRSVKPPRLVETYA
jgi:hypothetical protein